MTFVRMETNHQELLGQVSILGIFNKRQPNLCLFPLSLLITSLIPRTNLSWEADTRSASQEISGLFCNPKVRYHKSRHWFLPWDRSHLHGCTGLKTFPASRSFTQNSMLSSATFLHMVFPPIHICTSMSGLLFSYIIDLNFLMHGSMFSSSVSS